jgi:hypothetical protein
MMGDSGLPDDDVERVAQHLPPVAELQGARSQTGVCGDRLGEALERGEAPFLADGGDVEAADCFGEGPKQVRLAVPPAPGHDAQPHGGGGIGDEVGQQSPFPVAVDDLLGFGQLFRHVNSCTCRLRRIPSNSTSTDSVGDCRS